MSNASVAQYATATPVCLSCLHAAPGRLPHTGYTIAPLLIAAVLLILIGIVIREAL
jgi:hypothetical protein